MNRVLEWIGLRTGSRVRDEFVTVVSGLPRSGTSMMMRMLDAGGIAVLQDGEREPNVDNPMGYYEFERVKDLREGDSSWVPEARGKAVKVISELLKWLPAEHEYRVIFMLRDMSEILSSQREMLIRRRAEGGPTDDARMAELYEQHLEQVRSWLERQPHFDVVYLSYNDVLRRPMGGARRVSEFLGGHLDEAAMAAVVDPDLYRKRSPGAGQ